MTRASGGLPGLLRLSLFEGRDATGFAREAAPGGVGCEGEHLATWEKTLPLRKTKVAKSFVVVTSLTIQDLRHANRRLCHFSQGLVPGKWEGSFPPGAAGQSAPRRTSPLRMISST